MKKAELMDHWRQMPANQPILPHWTPIPKGSSGSTYGACGIRIDGNPAFVDAVLSRLKDLIDGENHVTRLGASLRPVDGSGIGKDLPNADAQAQVCYLRLHMRGPDGAAASAFFDKDLDGAQDRFNAAVR